MPKRVGSSEVNITMSMVRRGVKPAFFKARAAAMPPSTPTTPSYLPAWGMASQCEPVPMRPRKP